jgi:DNA polymerase
MEDGKLEVNGVTYDIVTLDYETFYSDDYTLAGKLNTSEYVRDDRFHVHGVAIKKGNGKTLWYTGRNIALALKEIDWSKTAMVCHNTAFDGFVTSEVYGHKPAFYVDTLSMSRATRGHATKHDLDTVAKALGHGGKVKREALANTKNKMQLTKDEEAKLGGYAVDDVEDTYKIFWDMYPYVPDNELRLIDITMRMFCDPVLEVDIPRVKTELEKELGAKTAALLHSGAQVEDLMSNDKFAQLLKAAGAQLPQKISPSTGKLTYAFAKSDLAFQDLMKSGNDKVRALCEARLKVKSTIGETRANRFLEAGRDGKKLPILLNYSGAHTHRWSGGNKMNLQNLKRGGELRRSILAPKGYVIVVADSAQIEARVLAWLAQQMDIVNAFATKQDVYKLMASVIYNVPVEDVTKDQRFIGKICVLGLGYGMGPQKLQQTLKQGTMGPPVDISEDECRRIVNIYRQKNWKIRAFWKKMDQMITNMTLGIKSKEGPIESGKGFLCLPNGLFLQYFGLHGTADVTRDDLVMTETTYLTRSGRAKLYGGLLTENVVQALARIIIAEQMLKIHDAGYRIVTMTHDEIVIIAKEKDAKKALDFMIKTMSTAPDWAPGLPLSAEGGFDYCYSK